MANGIQTFYLRDSKHWLELRKHFPHHHHFNFQGLNTTAFLPQLNYTSVVSSLTFWSIVVDVDGGVVFHVPRMSARWGWSKVYPLDTATSLYTHDLCKCIIKSPPPSPTSPCNYDPDANSFLIFA